MKPRFTSGIGAILLFFACVTLAVAGLTIVFTSTPRPVFLGWIYLVASVLLAGFTAHTWRPVLPGIFACGAINGCYMAVSGHVIGQADKPVSVAFALVLVLFFVAMAVLTAKTARLGPPVDLIDRASYGLFFLSLAVAFAVERAAIGGLIGMLGTVAFLAVRRSRRWLLDQE